MKKNLGKSSVLMFVLSLMTMFLVISCDIPSEKEQTSDSGVKKAHIKVQTDLNGNTTEQLNISEKVIRDNKVGSIKHLYVVSSFTGEVLQYSTVKGKVTSGGKRLSPKTVCSADGESNSNSYNWVTINGVKYATNEVLDEQGTYGESGNYLFWFDVNNNYHQYYPSGGTYLHISDKPMRIKNSSIALEF